MKLPGIKPALILCAINVLLAGCGANVSDSAGPTITASTVTTGTVEAAATTSFGLTADNTFYTVDTGAGLVFKIRRFDDGSSTRSAGDIASMIYNGVQFQDLARGTQINSGFDWVYNNTSAVTVSAVQVGTDYIKVTVQAGELTHYYMAKKGDPRIYMGTYFTREPDTLGMARFIVRVPIGALPNGPVPSDIRGTNRTVESGDIFALPNGETRSKHYSGMRLKDWSYIGATGNNVGLWIVRDNNEGGSGGPFYRSLINQGTSTTQELTYIMNYGEAQTEAFRTSVLNSFTLTFTDGSAPGAVDTSWFGQMGLLGYVSPDNRGAVAGASITGRDPGVAYTVGFSNAKAQYFTDVDPVDGHFNSSGMIPGEYTMKVYKNELAVETRTVTVAAGASTALDPIEITGDPASKLALWRIGSWDGSPQEFLNGDKLTYMHPSDVRMSPWLANPEYVVGLSNPAVDIPAYSWKAVNGAIAIRFNLRKSQIAPLTVRMGITVAFAGGRPKAQLNGWVSANPSPSTQPGTRTLTVGTYRGNNTMYTFNVPASELVVGENILYMTAISGSSGATFLSPGYAIDAIDLVKTQ